jgi:hypothetical protein
MTCGKIDAGLKADVTFEQPAHLVFQSPVVAALPSPAWIEANLSHEFSETMPQDKPAFFRLHRFGDDPEQKQARDGAVGIAD